MDPVITVSLAVVVGGAGFLVWDARRQQRAAREAAAQVAEAAVPLAPGELLVLEALRRRDAPVPLAAVIVMVQQLQGGAMQPARTIARTVQDLVDVGLVAVDGMTEVAPGRYVERFTLTTEGRKSLRAALAAGR